MAGVAEAAGAAAMSPLRSAAASMQSSFAASGAAVLGGDAASSATGAAASAEGAGPPAWARRMKRNQTISRGVAAANHAVRSGDHPASGGGVDLSEGE
jgi:type IV secretion system protein TrbL